MAITNAQQAKQIMNEGGPMRKIKGQDHMLAYITPGERDTLVDLGGQETMTPEGILAYPPEGNYGSEAKGPGSGPGKSGITGMASTGGANFSSGNNVADGGTGKTSNPTTRIGGEDFDVVDTNIKKRQEAEERAAAKRQREIDEFVETKRKTVNTPFPLVNTAFNFLGNVLPNSRKFYAANQNILSKYGYDLENYDQYDEDRKAGLINAYGRTLTDAERDNQTGGGGDNNQTYVPPIIPDDNDDIEEEEVVPDRNLGGIAPRISGSIFDFDGMADGGRAGAMDGGRMMMMNQEEDDPVGGIMDLETSRQMYGLGKLVKKITRGVKKVAKSPVGKAALMYFGGKALMGGMKGSSLFGKGPGSAFVKMFGANNTMPGFGNVSTAGMGGLFEKLGLVKGYGSMMPTAMGGILGATTLAGLLTPKEEEENNDDYYASNTIDYNNVRNNPYKFLSAANQGSRYNVADGGIMRNGYAEGSEEPVAKKTMPLLDMDGQEMDLREEGGFVPLGRMERADDVPARLSKNEFVFTAEAVRNAGEGDVDKGAEVMYNMMKNLESGGEVSEESQGLEGAREMFQTSQRLEEVI